MPRRWHADIFFDVGVRTPGWLWHQPGFPVRYRLKRGKPKEPAAHDRVHDEARLQRQRPSAHRTLPNNLALDPEASRSPVL